MSYKQFLEQKENIAKAFEKAIYTALIEMGDDIKGIDWFSYNSIEYNLQKEKENAKVT